VLAVEILPLVCRVLLVLLLVRKLSGTLLVTKRHVVVGLVVVETLLSHSDG